MREKSHDQCEVGSTIRHLICFLEDDVDRDYNI